MGETVWSVRTVDGSEASFRSSAWRYRGDQIGAIVFESQDGERTFRYYTANVVTLLTWQDYTGALTPEWGTES